MCGAWRRATANTGHSWSVQAHWTHPHIATAPMPDSCPCPTSPVDLIVTSPPYVTSYEYADLHQLSALWFQMATDLREFRQGFIGRSNGVHAPVGNLHSPLAETIVSLLSEFSPRKAREVALYFAEMYACFTEWRRVMRPGGYACIVIGNTHLSGIEVQNAQVFAEQLATLGFVLERVVLREIPSKILPRTRDKQTGKFAKTRDADYLAYPTEYVLAFRHWG
jgi:DNA modification methylase